MVDRLSVRTAHKESRFTYNRIYGDYKKRRPYSKKEWAMKTVGKSRKKVSLAEIKEQVREETRPTIKEE